MSELNLGFAEVSCILPESSKAAGTYCLWVEQRQHPPSQAPPELSKKASFLGGSMARFMLLSDRLLCWPHAKNLFHCPVKIMIKSSQKSLARNYFWQREKCCLSLCLGKKICQIHMANPKSL